MQRDGGVQRIQKKKKEDVKLTHYSHKTINWHLNNHALLWGVCFIQNYAEKKKQNFRYQWKLTLANAFWRKHTLFNHLQFRHILHSSSSWFSEMFVKTTELISEYELWLILGIFLRESLIKTVGSTGPEATECDAGRVFKLLSAGGKRLICAREAGERNDLCAQAKHNYLIITASTSLSPVIWGVVRVEIVGGAYRLWDRI